MPEPSLLPQVLGALLGNLPAVIVYLVAIVITLAWRARAPRAFGWALSGFGLLLVLSILMPAAHMLVAQWVFPGNGAEPRTWALHAISTAGSLLFGVAHLLLLAAIFAGRGKPGAENP